jgi:hypothetical protein
VYSGIVYFRISNDPEQLIMNLKRSVFFISILNLSLINLGQLPGLLEERAIYYKQQGAHFFRPQSFLFAKIVGSLPFSFLEVRIPVAFFKCTFVLADCLICIIILTLTGSLNINCPSFDLAR